MEDIDYWRISDHYSIVQAAILVCGRDPQHLQYEVENNTRNRPTGYIAIRTALFNAVRLGQLEPQTLAYERDEYGNQVGLDIHSTLIAVGDLDAFLRARGILCEIFDRSGLEVSGQLRSDHPQRPPKLDAAIRAWTAVTSDPSTLRGRSPKQALAKWLTEHAIELGLLKSDGTPNTTGIEEICKVANWKPRGGATPTPGRQEAAQPAPLWRLPAPAPRELKGPREEFTTDLDDEIPF
jgi:hypothetical protein